MFLWNIYTHPDSVIIYLFTYFLLDSSVRFKRSGIQSVCVTTECLVPGMEPAKQQALSIYWMKGWMGEKMNDWFHDEEPASRNTYPAFVLLCATLCVCNLARTKIKTLNALKERQIHDCAWIYLEWVAIKYSIPFKRH